MTNLYILLWSQIEIKSVTFSLDVSQSLLQLEIWNALHIAQQDVAKLHTKLTYIKSSLTVKYIANQHKF